MDAEKDGIPSTISIDVFKMSPAHELETGNLHETRPNRRPRNENQQLPSAVTDAKSSHK